MGRNAQLEHQATPSFCVLMHCMYPDRQLHLHHRIAHRFVAFATKAQYGEIPRTHPLSRVAHQILQQRNRH